MKRYPIAIGVLGLLATYLFGAMRCFLRKKPGERGKPRRVLNG